MDAHVRRQALPGHPPNPRADQLYGRHKWIRQQERPQQIVAELSTGLRVSADAGWIIICGSGNQTGLTVGSTIARQDRGSCFRALELRFRSWRASLRANAILEPGKATLALMRDA